MSETTKQLPLVPPRHCRQLEHCSDAWYKAQQEAFVRAMLLPENLEDRPSSYAELDVSSRNLGRQ